MNTRRELSHEELEALLNRLEEMQSTIKESYQYPLVDLIEYLRGSEGRRGGEVEEENGEPLRYYLGFSSPASTWQMNCGRSGFYTIDAATLNALNFHTRVMS